MLSHSFPLQLDTFWTFPQRFVSILGSQWNRQRNGSMCSFPSFALFAGVPLILHQFHTWVVSDISFSKTLCSGTPWTTLMKTSLQMSSCTRRRSSRPSPTSSTRPSPKCPVTETPRSVLELSLTSYLPCFFVYFLYNSHLRCNFYLDRHKLQL